MSREVVKILEIGRCTELISTDAVIVAVIRFEIKSAGRIW